MPLTIDARFSFTLPEPGDVLLQFEAAKVPEQTVLDEQTSLPIVDYTARVPAQDGIGERVWLRGSGTLEVTYAATVDVLRLTPDISGRAMLPMHELPGEAVPYLFGSRYCASDRLQSFALEEFGNSMGGERILAIMDWIAQNLTYRFGVSDAQTTALDTMVDRAGICRDFAHVLVALARASGLPARYVSVYAPEVEPQDFHAIAEVFLADPDAGGGAWYALDPTGMAKPQEMAKIGIGRDAADVSFMTSFGPCTFGDKQITVARKQG